MTLRYTAQTSLDGYTVDAGGDFSWSMPDAEVHQAVNDRERGTHTYVVGRRMYEVMRVWDDPTIGDHSPEMRDFQRIWAATDKVVASSSLTEVSAPRTVLVPRLDVAGIQDLVDRTPGVVSIGGPTLAADALRAGIVDEIHLLVSPVVVGGGTRALPDGARLDLELVDERRFTNGVVQVHYRPRG